MRRPAGRHAPRVAVAIAILLAAVLVGSAPVLLMVGLDQRSRSSTPTGEATTSVALTSPRLVDLTLERSGTEPLAQPERAALGSTPAESDPSPTDAAERPLGYVTARDTAEEGGEYRNVTVLPSPAPTSPSPTVAVQTAAIPPAPRFALLPTGTPTEAPASPVAPWKPPTSQPPQVVELPPPPPPPPPPPSQVATSAEPPTALPEVTATPSPAPSATTSSAPSPTETTTATPTPTETATATPTPELTPGEPECRWPVWHWRCADQRQGRGDQDDRDDDEDDDDD